MFNIYYIIPYDGQIAKLTGKSATIDDAINICRYHAKLMYFELGVEEITYQIYQDNIFMKEITIRLSDILKI